MLDGTEQSFDCQLVGLRTVKRSREGDAVWTIHQLAHDARQACSLEQVSLVPENGSELVKVILGQLVDRLPCGDDDLLRRIVLLLATIDLVYEILNIPSKPVLGGVILEVVVQLRNEGNARNDDEGATRLRSRIGIDHVQQGGVCPCKHIDDQALSACGRGQKQATIAVQGMVDRIDLVFMWFDGLAVCGEVQSLDDLADAILPCAWLHGVYQLAVNHQVVLAFLAELRQVVYQPDIQQAVPRMEHADLAIPMSVAECGGESCVRNFEGEVFLNLTGYRRFA